MPATWRKRRTPGVVSRREAEVLALMSEGRTAAEIGVVLGIHGRTVEAHKRTIYRRLGITATEPGYVAVAWWVTGQIAVEGD